MDKKSGTAFVSACGILQKKMLCRHCKVRFARICDNFLRDVRQFFRHNHADGKRNARGEGFCKHKRVYDQAREYGAVLYKFRAVYCGLRAAVCARRLEGE